ncbi:MDR family MFS transporter [Roseibium suaedae]|uniref:Drug resistance transporter, EmrB/QacA subfamily n=1 Tax=Roseibium suaedae TaxID=735517 RepID=A0A1M7CM56_9HYPH|nr:MDR family MFS transporter [Roseibium suaedae]SHL67929.1 drug resistance transporter, EmrB/QacA subfamily [Roseibium suaedae]
MSSQTTTADTAPVPDLTSGSTAGPAFGTAQEGPLITDKRLRLFVYLIMMCAVFMSMMDVQIVSTALPTIVGDFGTLEGFSWITSAYLLTSSAVMPLYGKLGDLFGRKYVLLAVIALFVGGSIACAAATTMETLIAARVLQALGGGGVMVTVFSVNADIFSPRERAKYQSYTSLVLMLAGTTGPTAGGFMTEHFGWRSIFLINVPIGVLVIIGLALLLPYRRPSRVPKIDIAGSITLAATIACLVLWADSPSLFGSITAPESLTVIGIGILCLLLWILAEKRAVEPVIPLSLFQNRTIVLLLIVSMAGGSMGIGLGNYYALYLQSGLGLSPSLAGLFFIPLTAGIAAGSLSAGRLIFRTGHYKYFAVASTSVSALALLALAFFSEVVSLPVIALFMFLQGMGTGIGQQVPILGIQNAAPRKDVGAATGLTTLSRIGAASVAISLYGTLITYVVTMAAGSVPGISNLASLTPEQIAALPETSRHLVNTVYVDALHPVFLVAAGIGICGCIAGLCVQNRRLDSLSN